MSDDELRRVFETVLTAPPPPDSTDIDTAIRIGRRRRHRRTAAVMLSAAAAVAVIGLTATTVLPSPEGRPVSAAASKAATGASITADDGVPVTSAQQLLGSWTTIELDGRDVRADRDLHNHPLGLKFFQYGDELWWSANDIVNANSGPVSVSERGQFQAQLQRATFVGPPEAGPQYERNPEVVEQATEARLVAATDSTSAKLLLLTDGKVTAVYTLTAR